MAQVSAGEDGMGETIEQRPSIPLADQGPGASAATLFMEDPHSTSVQTPTNASELSTSVPFVTDAMIVDFPQSDHHDPPSFVPSDFIPGKHSLVALEDPRLQTVPQPVPSFGHTENAFDSPINLPGPNPISAYNTSVVPHFQRGLQVPLQNPAPPPLSYLPDDYSNAPSRMHLPTSSRMDDWYTNPRRERERDHKTGFPNKRMRTDPALPSSDGMPPKPEVSHSHSHSGASHHLLPPSAAPIDGEQRWRQLGYLGKVETVRPR
ncbi:hypothetical protein BT69DRAFT_24904 [Atractiella rhizophila]|nr:hypothetical protein BT69DRAFT_24904 [Atractiella rhizophila]